MASADLKMEELDHEAYETENPQESNDFSTGDNGAGDGDSMMEDPVRKNKHLCLFIPHYQVSYRN